MKINKLLIILSAMLVVLPLTSAYAIDTDMDGLDDLYESQVYGTNPNNPDSDGDGYFDGDELSGGYNPNGEGSLSPEIISSYATAIAALEQAKEDADSEDGIESTSEIEDTNGIEGEGGTGIEETSENGTEAESTNNIDEEEGIESTSGIEGTSGIEEGSGSDSLSNNEIEIIDEESNTEINNDPVELENLEGPEIIDLEDLYEETPSQFGLVMNMTNENPVLHSKVNTITKDQDGNIWIATEKGLIKKDDTSLSIYTEEQGLLEDNLKDIYIGKDNILWGISTSGVTKFDLNLPALNSAFVYYDEDNGFDTNLGENIFVDSENYVWVGTSNNAAYVFTGNEWMETGNVLTEELGEEFTNITITDILATSNENLWLSTSEQGVIEIEVSTSEKTAHQTQDGIISNQINSLFVDQDDNVYVITDFGISKYVNENWKNIQTRGKVKGNTLNTLYVDNKNNLYLGTEQGLNKYDELASEWSFIGIDNKIAGEEIFSIFEDDNNQLFIGTDKGLTIIDLAQASELALEGVTKVEEDEPVLDDVPIVNTDTAITDNNKTDEFINLIKGEIEKAKTGDIQSIVKVVSPIVVLLLALLLIVSKTRKKDVIIVDNLKEEEKVTNITKASEEVKEDTNRKNSFDLPKRNYPIASIGKPIGNISSPPINDNPVAETPVIPAAPKPPMPPVTPSTNNNAVIPAKAGSPVPPTPAIPKPPMPPVPPTAPVIPTTPKPPVPPTAPVIPTTPKPPVPPVPPTAPVIPTTPKPPVPPVPPTPPVA